MSIHNKNQQCCFPNCQCEIDPIRESPICDRSQELSYGIDEMIVNLSKRYYLMMDDENKLFKVLHLPDSFDHRHEVERLGFTHRQTNDAPILGKVTVFEYPESY